MLSVVFLVMVWLSAVVSADLDANCTTLPSTAPSCILSTTVSLPIPSGSVDTIYCTTVTSQVNAVDCNYCQVTNVIEEPVALGPFTSTVTSDSLVITTVTCIPSLPAVSRRHAVPKALTGRADLLPRDSEASTIDGFLKQHNLPVPKDLHHIKHQALPDSTAGLAAVTTGPFELFRQIIRQLLTFLYAIGVINSGGDLRESCTRLRSANAILDLARIDVNATQAASIVCDVSKNPSRLGYFNQSLVDTAERALFGIRIASNYTGTLDPKRLCDELELDSLGEFQIDVAGIKEVICGANSSTTTTALNSTVLATTSAISTGTMMPFPFSNSSDGAVSQTDSTAASGMASSSAGSLAQGTITSLVANTTAASSINGTGGAAAETELPTADGTAIPTIVTNGTVGSRPVNTEETVSASSTGSPTQGTAASLTANATAAVGSNGAGPRAANATSVPTSFNGTIGLETDGEAQASGSLAGSVGTGGSVNSSTITVSTAVSGSGLNGYATAGPTAGQPWGGYGAPSGNMGADGVGYVEESPTRVPYGPTSTPGYYP